MQLILVEEKGLQVDQSIKTGHPDSRGTGGSNSVCSTDESVANSTFGAGFLPRYEIPVARALYHRFLERIVARVPVTALLQRGYTVRDNVRECTDEA
jgi:hypothetical protein